MHRENVDRSIRAGFFSDVAKAGQAVRRLLAAGFSKDQLAVICPDQFKDHFSRTVPQAERPGSNAVEGITGGAALGATLGGIALGAAAIGTGGAALLPAAAAVLVGGGALAGGFSGLILADGYGKGVGEYYQQAIELGKIVVGVQVKEDNSAARLEEAGRILAESGADFLEPAPA